MIYENINIPLWNAIQNTRGQRVLDVGCGTGALGELVRANENRVEGITYSQEEAEIAKARLDEVHVLDLNRLAESGIPLHGPFDTMVFGDVLEHLLAPQDTLAALLPLLAPGGRLFVSLPNVACFYVRFGLLLGRFNMSPHGGILDETHLHFYTRKTARKLLTDSGLTVERTDYMPAMSVWAYQFLKGQRRHAAQPQKDNPSFQFYARRVYPVERIVTVCWPGMLANQFVFTCRRT